MEESQLKTNSEALAQQNGPPYPPRYQGLGGEPTRIPDVPISAVFLALFVTAAVAHMTIFQINKRHGKKFVLNAATFGFCMTRIIATTLRICWTFNPMSVRLGMAANIFVYAGIPILFVANLYFAERIVRAQHPPFGWSKPFSLIIPVSIFITIASIFCLIAAVIVQYYTLDEFSQHAARDIQLYGVSFFAVLATLPLFIVAASCLARAQPRIRMTKAMDKFGSGSMRAKIVICLVSGVLLSLGAWYRAAIQYLPPTPLIDGSAPAPLADYYAKPAFYVFNFTIEIIVVYSWLFVRIDRRFFVPDGAKGPFSYAGGFVFAGEPGNEKATGPTAGNNQRRSSRGFHSRGSSTTTVGDYIKEGKKSTSAETSRSRSRSGTTPSRQTSGAGTRTSWGPVSPRGRSRSRSRVLIREERISWGGIPRNSVLPAFGEDGEMLPYGGCFSYDPETGNATAITKTDWANVPFASDPMLDPTMTPAYTHRPPLHESVHRQAFVPTDINDTEAPAHGAVDEEFAEEMGFDERTGKWALRPISEARLAARRRTLENKDIHEVAATEARQFVQSELMRQRSQEVLGMGIAR